MSMRRARRSAGRCGRLVGWWKACYEVYKGIVMRVLHLNRSEGLDVRRVRIYQAALLLHYLAAMAVVVLALFPPSFGQAGPSLAEVLVCFGVIFILMQNLFMIHALARLEGDFSELKHRDAVERLTREALSTRRDVADNAHTGGGQP